MKPGRAEHSADPLSLVLLAVVAAILLAAGWLWITARVAGRLFAGRWPDMPLATSIPALAELAGDPADPAAAWPPGVAALQPGPVEFYATAVALLAVPGIACMLVGWCWTWLGGRHDAAVVEPTAWWADVRDLGPLIVRRPESARLTLGRVDGRLIAAEPLQSVCLFGPARSGKTTAFAVPAVLEWDGPAIVCSVKTDLVADTITHRMRTGQVKVYDPLGLTEWPGASWSPLGQVDSWGDARRAAHDLAQVAQASRGLQQSTFWLESAADLMAPLLWAGASSGQTMGDVVRWVRTPHRSRDEVVEALESAGVPQAVEAFLAVTDDEPRTRSNIYTSTRQFLAAFADPKVDESARSCDITPEWLHASDRSNTVYLCAPSHDQDRLGPLFVSLLHEQLRRVYEWQQSPDNALGRPLLVVLDEAANIAALPDLDHLASTCAGHRIQLVTIFQDLAQVRARWGERAQTVINNHRATVFLSGLKDDATLR
ncbi:MAG: type IV secretory system conjugative DNA transfer family protein [Actinomycetota bacterium]|nr:type IV secretory system conjugative DNA transfer family protein [Actinomycetota bacterium]